MGERPERQTNRRINKGESTMDKERYSKQIFVVDIEEAEKWYREQEIRLGLVQDELEWQLKGEEQNEKD